MENNKVTLVIADDDPVQLELLTSLTQKLRPEWEIVASVSDSARAMDAIQEFSPTLCILDIQLSDATGIEIVNSVPGGVPVIFVTGHSSYAVDAFDCAAIDFVVKPVRQERLEAAFKKAEVALLKSATSGPGGTKGGLAPSLVRFTKGRDLMMALLEDVRYFQAQHKYTRVVLKDQEGLLRMSLSVAIQHLDPKKFWRVHRSYVVNVEQILSSNRDEMNRIVLRIKDRDERLYVSKPYEHLFSRDGFS